jgi:TonB family protein
MLFALPVLPQDVVTVDPSLAQKHLTHKVDPQYPADALAAQVQGTVTLRLSIDTTGHVTDAEVTSGPELLQQAAVNAARQWVYQPFAIGGKPLAAAAQVKVTFTLPATPAAATVAAAPRAAPTPQPVVPPPTESKPGFDSAAGAAQATPTAAPTSDSSSGFEPAAGSAASMAPTVDRAPATSHASFESAAPPSETTAAAVASRPAPSTSGFESAAPPPETAPPAEAATAATPPPPASKQTFDASVPVQPAPAPMPPAEATSTPEPAVASPVTPTDPGNFASFSAQCHKLMATQGDVNTLVAVCGAMADSTDNFPPDSHYIERRAAYVFDAAALLRAWKYPEAELMAKRAVAVVEEGHDDVTGASAAYAVLGNAQALNGKLAEADKNLETAEALERQAVTAAAGQPQETAYSGTLRTILLFHAETLERMGNKHAAEAKRAEAAKLLPVPGN